MSDLLERLRTRIATVQLLIQNRWPATKGILINIFFFVSFPIEAAYLEGNLRAVSMFILAAAFHVYSYGRGVEDTINAIGIRNAPRKIHGNENRAAPPG